MVSVINQLIVLVVTIQVEYKDDGDALNVTILLDGLVAEQFKNFESHFNVPDATKPYGIAGTLGLLSSVTSITSNYLGTKIPTLEVDTINASLAKVSTG